MCRLDELEACSHKSAHRRLESYLNVAVMFSFGQELTSAEILASEHPYSGRTMLTQIPGKVLEKVH